MREEIALKINLPESRVQVRTRYLKPGSGGGGGRGDFVIWPIRGCATGQGMGFDLSVLNRVYNFV